MVGRTIPLNSVQKLPTVKVTGTVTTAGSTAAVVYTCPTGKKAVITASTWQMIALGANSYLQSRFASALARKVTLADTQPVQDVAGLGLALAAGDTIAFVGDNAGNNGTINYFMTVQESAA